MEKQPDKHNKEKWQVHSSYSLRSLGEDSLRFLQKWTPPNIQFELVQNQR